jgi:hypothetical protein
MAAIFDRRIAVANPARPLSPAIDGVEDRLQLRVKRRSDPTRDLNRDGARSALDVRVVARANIRRVRGRLLRESEGFASCSYHTP